MYLRLLAGFSTVAFATSTAAAQNNTSIYDQVGANNNASVDNTAEGNSNNSSVILQNGVFNSATVFQRLTANTSFIQQVGSFQTATHQQVGNFNQANATLNGDFQIMAATQVGSFNSSSVSQSGLHNRAIVRQGYAVDASIPNGELRAADFNNASIDQIGAGLNAVVEQRGASQAAFAASENQAFVTQRSSGSSTSIQQSSTIIQESRGNFGRVLQLDGAVDAANTSTVVQRNLTNPGALSLNSATVEQRGQGQQSTITQNGISNRASAVMAGGGAGGVGNTSVIDQQGVNQFASYTAVRMAADRSLSNRSQVTQLGNEHESRVFQAGVGDQVTVRQENGVNVGTYADGAIARGSVYVSQNSRMSSIAIDQTGDNYSEAVQALGENQSVTLDQTDAGDIAGMRASNTAIISQYGTNNQILLTQDSIGATATVWQQRSSSSNVATIEQGTGQTALASTSGVPGFSAGSTGAATSGLATDIVQAGIGNRGTVYQDGVSLQVRVEQFGVSTGAAPNNVFVSQTGSGNRANVVQGAGVGPSTAGDPASGNSAADNGGTADEFYFAGGSRSAEVAILQTSSNNSASVRQDGRGQLARIEQSGAGNVAGITQELGGTNATAIIRQTGNNNSYFIVQTTPGQYIAVSQTGSNNVVTNVVKRGPDGGSNGFVPPPGG